jgi:hypothetical protein
MEYTPAVASVRTLSASAQTFIRIEWTPGWSIFVRRIVIPLALLAGLLWGGTASHLDVILKQLLN